MTKSLTALALLCATSIFQTQGEDWPQWGGPARDHVSKEKGLLQKWPAGGPKRVWLSTEAGLGYSGVSVADGRVYTMGAREGTEFLLAFDLKDGKEVWSAEIGALLRNNWGDGPRGTPTVAEGRVYALGGQGTLIAVNAKDGKLQWKKTMQSLGGVIQNWGFTESVLVENGVVYCTPGGKKGAMAALDAATGNVKWQSKDFTEETQYSSIVPTDLNGARQLIQFVKVKVVGINAKDGALLWEADFPGRSAAAIIPTPVVKDNAVFVTSGYGTGCKMIRINAGNKVEEVYANKVMVNHHGGVVLVGNNLYGYSDGKGWVCQDFATGKEIWADKTLGKGALTYADGRLYCLDESKGTVVLAEASPQGWKEHGRFVLDPQTQQRSNRGKIWTHPVIANGRLYLRDQELLSCYDVSGGTKTASIQ
jgi:outer membrane protein assembly factor BamB